MLLDLKVQDVGPARAMELRLGRRVNLITGDNGVGKSFLLDVAWWALTGNWASSPARPGPAAAAPQILFHFDTRSGASKQQDKPITFDRKRQEWTRSSGRPGDPGLVIYAQVDGGFSVWDPARNYYRTRKGADPDRPEAFQFSRDEVWNGKEASPGQWLCNGLVRDWERWQLENGEAMRLTMIALTRLSPPDEPMTLGAPAVMPGNAQRVPTLRSASGQEVPITLASAGVRRICALSYLLVWTWLEHRAQRAAQHLPPTHDVIFLIDEIEAHLHPKWQRVILGALRGVVDELLGTGGGRVQILATTHSPLVMVSAEDWFDPAQDAWFDLDVVDGDVRLARRTFERRGVASAWLQSEAFDLGSERSPKAEALLDEVATAMRAGPITVAEARSFERRLADVHGELDPFWPRWRFLVAQRGWAAKATPAGVARDGGVRRPRKKS